MDRGLERTNACVDTLIFQSHVYSAARLVQSSKASYMYTSWQYRKYLPETRPAAALSDAMYCLSHLYVTDELYPTRSLITDGVRGSLESSSHLSLIHQQNINSLHVELGTRAMFDTCY